MKQSSINMEVILNRIKEKSVGYNIKYLFRHSNRPSLKGVNDSLSIGITEEGAQKAYLLGENLPWPIGIACTSISKRCVETIEEIVRGSKTPEIEIIRSQTLTSPAIIDENLINNLRYSVLNLKTVVHMLSNGNTLPGIYPIHITAEKILDYIFSKGCSLDKLDIFCTHDFNIALLLQYLFPFINTQEMIIQNWPEPLEGMFMWGERNDFYCFWKGKISHHLITYK